MPKINFEFSQYLTEKYPRLLEGSSLAMEDLISENLIADSTIELPNKTLERIKQIIFDFSIVRSYWKKSKEFQSRMQELNLQDPGNLGLMMSYDFHLDENDNPILIEINTNAAFHIMNYELLQFRSKPNTAFFSPEQFRKNILHEVHLWSQTFTKDSLHVAIIDQSPHQQKLFIEFLLAKEWVESFGWKCDIRDTINALAFPSPDFIYNRSTDFYFENCDSAAIRKGYTDKTVCVSPHPHEYGLLADKQSLIYFSNTEFLKNLGVPANTIESVAMAVPECYDLQRSDTDFIWQNRKKFFFKPQREYGSKRAFKGASISRKTFEELLSTASLAQKFIPPPEHTLETPNGPQTFKYDLRCYAYGERYEGSVARLYQGQVTNLRTPYGGFAPVVFTDS